jgi:hypothetical protein
MTYSTASITQCRIIRPVNNELSASERQLPRLIYGAVKGMRKNTNSHSNCKYAYPGRDFSLWPSEYEEDASTVTFSNTVQLRNDGLIYCYLKAGHQLQKLSNMGRQSQMSKNLQ